MNERALERRLIQSIPLFASLPADELRDLVEKLELNAAPDGAILFSEAEPADRFSIVVSGAVEIIKAMGTPEERTLAVLGPGEIIGEMSLLYSDRLRSASGRARGPVQLLEMTLADFDALLHRRPELALGIMQAMSERLRNSENATIRDLQEKNRQLAIAYQELKAAQALLIEKEKLEHELNMARRIQARTLPKETPALPGWQISAHWQPARAVSGDFYDFIAFPNGEWGLVIGDVTDKGVPAALVMATSRSVIRSVALSAAQSASAAGGEQAPGSISPGAILAQVNSLLCPDMPANMFVTCLFAVLDPETGRLRYANAGQNLPYLRSAGGVLELRATGMPLGLLPDMPYEERERRLAPGDLVLFYSDGLIEAHNPEREMYGTPRLLQALTNETSDNLVEALLSRLAGFTGPGWEQEDDVTLMTLAWVGSPAL
jgi:serine phosphatase RsbU (regulator of sigma subunit)